MATKTRPGTDGTALDGFLAATRAEIQALRQEVAELRDMLASRPVVRPAALTNLASDRFQLARPIQIITEDYDGSVTARFWEVEAFGEGDTETEAVAALKRAIVALFEDLRDAPDEVLGVLPREWRRLLNELIVDRAAE